MQLKTFRQLANRQRGAATLITSLILLVAMTIITIFAARSAIMEQKIFANEFRAKQAFEAAEAGLEYTLAYLLTAGGADKDDDGTIDAIDMDGDLSTANTLSNSSEFSVSITDNSGGNMTNLTVESTGLSDDDSARAIVSQVVVIVPAIPDVPGNPVISKGAVSINGAAEVINPEGNATIWTGDNNVTFSGASGKTQIPDPSNPSQLIDSSDANGLGPDVIAGDTNLSSMTDAQFFQAFMGTDATSYQNAAQVREVPAANAANAYNHSTLPGIDLAREEVIWVNGNPSLNGNTTVGCTVTVTGSGTCPSANTKPVVMVIDGNLSGNGTVKVYGLVYITGDFAGSGNLEVTGAVIMEGDVTGTGSLNVTYSSSVLGSLSNIPISAGSLAGSWHDFN